MNNQTIDPDSWRSSAWVAGVDGCPDGWIVVLLNPETSDFHVTHCADFSSVLTLDLAPRVIAIDMPIGLPDRIEGPGRVAEQAVRPMLGQRQSSVFSIPARAAVYADSYLGACEAALAGSAPPKKVSKQSFNIFAKIREIDALMTPGLQSRVCESHPEVIFTMLNDGEPAPLPKKVKSQSNPPGLVWREALLQRNGVPEAVFSVNPKDHGKAARDDLVDAAACAACALRIMRGTAQRFPNAVTRDAKGLDIAIWA